MTRAVLEARKCVPEDGIPRPLVAAVAVANGRILGAAFRGELQPGEHAEYTLLEKKLRTDSLAGATIYTTLEPCTKRNHPKVPCIDRLIDRRVSRVVVGMLDPNQTITGRGILRLRRAGIEVDLFPAELMAQLEDLNREFTRTHDDGPGSGQSQTRQLETEPWIHRIQLTMNHRKTTQTHHQAAEFLATHGTHIPTEPVCRLMSQL